MIERSVHERLFARSCRWAPNVNWKAEWLEQLGDFPQGAEMLLSRGEDRSLKLEG